MRSEDFFSLSQNYKSKGSRRLLSTELPIALSLSLYKRAKSDLYIDSHSKIHSITPIISEQRTFDSKISFVKSGLFHSCACFSPNINFFIDCPFLVFILCVMLVDLKKLKSEGTVVLNKFVYRYMFDDLDGLAEIEVDLLRFWWLWRKFKPADCLRLIGLEL